MESFDQKSRDQLSMWLVDEGFTEAVVEVFKENDVDGEAFLLLSNDDIRTMVKPIGAQLKLIRKRDLIKETATFSHSKKDEAKITRTTESVVDITDSGSEGSEVSDMCTVAVQLQGNNHSLDDEENSHFLDNEEERDGSEDEVNSGSNYHSDEEPYHWNSVPSNTSPKYIEHKSLACTSTRSLKDITNCNSNSKLPLNATTPCRSKEKSSSAKRVYQASLKLQGKLEEEEMCTQPSKRLKVEESSITPIKRITQRKQEPPLPRPFPLPRNFTPSITLALESEKLTGKERAKFMTAIAHSIFTYKSYPTKAELEHVAQEMMKKWKFLATLGTDIIVDYLIERFKYFRKDKPKLNVKAAGAPSIPKKQMPATPAPPIVPHGEDEASHKRHLNMLSLEAKKVKPNEKSLMELMKRTFPIRRQDIVDNSVPIATLLKQYPPLEKYRYLVAEMDQIMESQISKTIVSTWEDLADKVIILASEETDNRNLQAFCELSPDLEKLDEGAKSIYALILLYYLMPDTRTRPDHSRIISIVPETQSPNEAAARVCTAQPCLVVRGSLDNIQNMFLVIEKKKLCKVPFCEAPLALLCAFYVFNLHYTDGCTNFYTLFEVLFLGKKVPPKKTKLAAFLGQIKGMD